MSMRCKMSRSTPTRYIIASAVVWGDRIEGSARDVLAEAETIKAKDESGATALGEAREFLLDLLKDGPLPTKEVRAAAHNAGQSWRTIGRAKAELEIKTGRKRDGWPWFLPQDQLGQEEIATKTLAELARIKKVKKKQKAKPCQELCQTDNLGRDVGSDNVEQNQAVKPSLPTLPSTSLARNLQPGAHAHIPPAASSKVRVRL
jgi:hypothetical protein